MKNLLLSIADDQRADTIGALGDDRVRTPHFNALAVAGTAFTNARCENGDHAAVCIPSRAALHTGRPVATVPLDCGSHPTLGSVLKENGYLTHGVGKWHNGTASFQRSFESGEALFFNGMHDHIGTPLHDYDPTGAYNRPRPCEKFSSEAFADAAVAFLRARDRSRPFFLMVGWTSPHDPRTPPPGFRYDPSTLEVPPNFLPDHPFDNGELRIRDEELAPHPRSAEDIRRHLADYFGMVSELDAQFGRILEELRTQGLEDDTLVVHTADHGLSLGQHGLLGKQNLYEASVRIPLLLRGRGIPAGGRHNGLCLGCDIAPTLLEWAGVPRPESMTGRPLLSASQRGGPVRDRATAFYKDFQQSVTDGEWKLIRTTVRGAETLQLFHLQNDPWEMNNLAATEPDEIRRLMPCLPRGREASSWIPA